MVKHYSQYENDDEPVETYEVVQGDGPQRTAPINIPKPPPWWVRHSLALRRTLAVIVLSVVAFVTFEFCDGLKHFIDASEARQAPLNTAWYNDCAAFCERHEWDYWESDRNTHACTCVARDTHLRVNFLCRRPRGTFVCERVP